jgi:hypothetical protein
MRVSSSAISALRWSTSKIASELVERGSDLLQTAFEVLQVDGLGHAGLSG